MAKILLVEDDFTNLGILKNYVQGIDQSIFIIKALNAVDGYKLAQEHLPDLIITDWDLGNRSGLDLLNDLKAAEQTKDIPVIMATAKTDDKSLKAAFEAGAIDYIEKPYNQIRFQARVKSALRMRKAYTDLESILYRIFPQPIAQELKNEGWVAVRTYPQAIVLSIDFENFQAVAQSKPMDKLIAELEFYFDEFDEILAKFGFEKIKTLSNTYLAMGGIQTDVPLAVSLIQALEAALAIKQMMRQSNQNQAVQWQCDISLSCGYLITGVIGKKSSFDVWGEAFDQAFQLSLVNAKGNILLTPSVFEKVRDFFEAEAQDQGAYYRLLGIKDKLSENGEGQIPNALFRQKQAELTQQATQTPINTSALNEFSLSDLKTLLANDKTEKVLQVLLHKTQNTEHEYKFILLNARWSDLQTSLHLGTKTQAEASVEKTKIQNSLLTFMDELDI
jgi:CheY-like chemotaxis protein